MGESVVVDFGPHVWPGRDRPDWGQAQLPGGHSGAGPGSSWRQLSKPATNRRCPGVSAARRSYRCRVHRTASGPGTPSSTARHAMAVPVRPRPPRQAISTRSHSLRRHTSSRASRAARRSDGSRKSGHRSQACGHGTAGGSRPSRYRPYSGSLPSGSARRKARPRTRRPDGSTTTPAPSWSHAPDTTAP